MDFDQQVYVFLPVIGEKIINSLEPFRVIIVLNHLEGRRNTLQFEFLDLNSTWNGFWVE